VSSNNAIRNENEICFDNLESVCTELMWLHFIISTILILNKVNESFDEIYKNRVKDKKQEALEKKKAA